MIEKTSAGEELTELACPPFKSEYDRHSNGVREFYMLCIATADV